jgi:hypothetical protein
LILNFAQGVKQTKWIVEGSKMDFFKKTSSTIYIYCKSFFLQQLTHTPWVSTVSGDHLTYSVEVGFFYHYSWTTSRSGTDESDAADVGENLFARWIPEDEHISLPSSMCHDDLGHCLAAAHTSAPLHKCPELQQPGAMKCSKDSLLMNTTRSVYKSVNK